MKSRLRPFTWDQFIVLIVSLIGFAFTLSSLDSPDPKSQRDLASADVVDLGCMNVPEASQTYFRKRALVRIRGRLCSEHRSQRFDSSLTILNLSSGKETVAFIQAQDQQFLSSELPLIPGSNEIRIEWKDKVTGITRSKTAQIFTEPI